jgi:hypothetical protein
VNPKPFNLAKIKPMKGVDVHPKGTTGEIPIDGEEVFRRQFAKHAVQHSLHVANAAKTMAALPEPGEVIHVLMSGNFAGWDYVPAFLKLAEPATIKVLHVATLGFSERNTHELLTMLDDGRIGNVWFLCSHYMSKQDAHIFTPMAKALTIRGQRIKATRNHAKLMAIELTDGRKFTIDGSMNLRSCRNVEQCNITRSDEVHDFYAGYIRHAIEGEK